MDGLEHLVEVEAQGGPCPPLGSPPRGVYESSIPSEDMESLTEDMELLSDGVEPSREDVEPLSENDQSLLTGDAGSMPTMWCRLRAFCSRSHAAPRSSDASSHAGDDSARRRRSNTSVGACGVLSEDASEPVHEYSLRASPSSELASEAVSERLGPSYPTTTRTPMVILLWDVLRADEKDKSELVDVFSAPASK